MGNPLVALMLRAQKEGWDLATFTVTVGASGALWTAPSEKVKLQGDAEVPTTVSIDLDSNIVFIPAGAVNFACANFSRPGSAN